MDSDIKNSTWNLTIVVKRYLAAEMKKNVGHSYDDGGTATAAAAEQNKGIIPHLLRER